MSDDIDLDAAVEAFLDEADAAFSEYENGYTDADAVLRRLEPEIDRLRDAADD